jgi:hypothetical protein
MRVIKNFFVSLMLLIISIILGVVGSVWIGYRIEHPPVDTSWEKFDSTVKFTNIVDANSGWVWV